MRIKVIIAYLVLFQQKVGFLLLRYGRLNLTQSPKNCVLVQYNQMQNSVVLTKYYTVKGKTRSMKSGQERFPKVGDRRNPRFGSD